MEVLPHTHKDHRTIAQPPITPHTLDWRIITHTHVDPTAASSTRHLHSIRTFTRNATLRHCSGLASALKAHARQGSFSRPLPGPAPDQNGEFMFREEWRGLGRDRGL